MITNTELTIPGFQSLTECRQSILDLAQRINDDVSSTIINAARIKSLRSLLDLFEQYNTLLIGQSIQDSLPKNEVEKLNHLAYEDVMNVAAPQFPDNPVYMEKYSFWRSIAGENHFDPHHPDLTGRN